MPKFSAIMHKGFNMEAVERISPEYLDLFIDETIRSEFCHIFLVFKVILLSFVVLSRGFSKFAANLGKIMLPFQIMKQVFDKSQKVFIILNNK